MSQLRQRPMLAVYLALLTLVTAATIALAGIWLNSGADDRLAVIANILSLGTFALALVAGVIALAAYIAATGKPDLIPQIMINGEYPAEMTFALDVNNYIRESDGMKALILDITLRNESGYAARTPALLIELHGAVIARQEYSSAPAWTPIEAPSHLITAMQWDGGPNYSIHGESYRQLPPVNFGGLRKLPGLNEKCSIHGWVSIRPLADGYSPSPVKVDLLSEEHMRDVRKIWDSEPAPPTTL